MRIIINVKCRGGKTLLETRIDGSSRDNVRGMNVGEAVYKAIKAMSDDAT